LGNGQDQRHYGTERNRRHEKKKEKNQDKPNQDRFTRERGVVNKCVLTGGKGEGNYIDQILNLRSRVSRGHSHKKIESFQIGKGGALPPSSPGRDTIVAGKKLTF